MQVLIVVVCFGLFLVQTSLQWTCSGPDCSPVDPLSQQRLRRNNGAYKRRDEYDFVRFGKRAEAQKKAGYDYVRFGKRSGGSSAWRI